jgi:hypothetical protein
MTTLPALSAKADHLSARLDAWVLSRQSPWKPATTNRTTSTVSDDPDLTVQIEPNAVYRVSTFWAYLCAAGSVNLNIGWTTPAGVDGRWGGAFTLAEDSSPRHDSKTWAQMIHVLAAAGAEGAVFMTGTIWTTTSGGTLAVQWAQLASSASAVGLKLGSYLDVVRIGDN